MAALTFELDEVIEGYSRVGLRPIADYLKTFACRPLSKHEGVVRAFGEALQALSNARVQGHVARTARRADAMLHADLQVMHTGAAYGLTAAQLKALAAAEWVRKGASVVVTGPAHSGKTHLGSVLLKEVAKRSRVCRGRHLLRVERIHVASWLQEHEHAPMRRGLPEASDALVAADLLILDNFAQRSMNVAQAALLLDLIEARQLPKRKSILVLSPLPQREWLQAFECQVIGESVCARFFGCESAQLSRYTPPQQVVEI